MFHGEGWAWIKDNRALITGCKKKGKQDSKSNTSAKLPVQSCVASLEGQQIKDKEPSMSITGLLKRQPLLCEV